MNSNKNNKSKLSKLSKENFKLAIALPITWSHVPVEFMTSMTVMEKPFNYTLILSTFGRIDEIRNQLVQSAQEQNCSHILFLDTDHYHSPQTIKKLLSHELPIVSGLSFLRTPPHEPVMMKGEINAFSFINEWEENSLVQVDATGAASLLVDMEVFDKLKKPYFQFLENPNPNILHKIGEDVAFCLKAKEAGYKIFVDTSCQNDHLSQIKINQDYWENWRDREKGE